MKRLLVLAAATFLTSSAFAIAQGNGNGGPGASEHAPGQTKSEGQSARDNAPGQMKSEGESARDYAPGQQDKLDDDTTGSIGGDEFDRALSLIGSDSFDPAAFSADTDVSVVRLSDISEEERQELQDAIAANQASVDSLRQNLASLDLAELDQDEIDGAVAVDASADGEITVYVQ